MKENSKIEIQEIEDIEYKNNPQKKCSECGKKFVNNDIIEMRYERQDEETLAPKWKHEKCLKLNRLRF